MTAIPVAALPAASAVGDPVVTVQSAGSDADQQVRLVADTGTRDPQTIRASDLSATVSDRNNSGRAVPIRAVPLLSDRSDVVAVLDTASAAASGLPEVRSGMTDLLLQLPPSARTGAVVAGAQPRLLAPLATGATGALGRLSEVEASGSASNAGASTATALGLALQALGERGGSTAATSARPRVVVLQTSARDAGGESAAQLGERLRKAAVVLEVVTTSEGSAYWRSVAEATGGVANSGASGAAFNRISDALRHTFLVSFARPAGDLDGVSLRFGGAAGGAGAFVDLTTPGSSAADNADAGGTTGGDGSGPGLGTVVNVLALVLLALAAGLVLHGLRRRPRGAHEAGVPVRPVPAPETFRRAAAPPREQLSSAEPPAEPPLEPSRPSSNGVPDVDVASPAASPVAPRVPPQTAAAPAPPVPAQTPPLVEPPAPVPVQTPPPAERSAPAQPVVSDVPPESAAVIEARRRARATGAAVAAAARAAAAVRTPASRPRPGTALPGARVEPERQGHIGTENGTPVDPSPPTT